jgi:hypothetical protein
MAQISHVLARLKRDPISNLPIAAHVDQQCREQNIRWRERLLPPLVTLRLFMIQILGGNCAIAALRQLSGIDFAPSSYCESRIRMPLLLLQSLLLWLHEQAEDLMKTTKKIGQRILIADGSTYSMEDTPELRARFNLPKGAKEGVGYPSGKLMGLLDAVTGMFVSLLALPLFQHDMRAVISVHPFLRIGDILLGDRAFCSFAHFALLNDRGVFVCMRLHQRRKNPTQGMTRWKKPQSVAAWMTAAQHALLPAFIDVRIVRYSIEQKGCRTRHVWIATTLMDEKLWPDEEIADLYGCRWMIETCFDHLKTTMKMNVLRCKSVAGVEKELAVYLAVYNLVRLAMLKAAEEQDVSAWRISFVDAMRWLAARMLGLEGVGRLIVNPDRRGRAQLRVIRRRLKEYDLLTKPRREKEAEIAEKQGLNA